MELLTPHSLSRRAPSASRSSLRGRPWSGLGFYAPGRSPAGFDVFLVAEGVGFEPTELALNGFQDRRLRPLGHPSASNQKVTEDVSRHGPHCPTPRLIYHRPRRHVNSFRLIRAVTSLACPLFKGPWPSAWPPPAPRAHWTPILFYYILVTAAAPCKPPGHVVAPMIIK